MPSAPSGGQHAQRHANPTKPTLRYKVMPTRQLRIESRLLSTFEPMRHAQKSVATTALLLAAWPAAAYASNGLLTLVVGIPLLLVACALLALMLAFRSRKPARIAAVVLFAPTLAYSLYVSLDAVELLKHIGSENSMIGLAFFGLLVLSCVLFYMVARNRSARG